MTERNQWTLDVPDAPYSSAPAQRTCHRWLLTITRLA